MNYSKKPRIFGSYSTITNQSFCVFDSQMFIVHKVEQAIIFFSEIVPKIKIMNTYTASKELLKLRTFQHC